MIQGHETQPTNYPPPRTYIYIYVCINGRTTVYANAHTYATPHANTFL